MQRYEHGGLLANQMPHQSFLDFSVNLNPLGMPEAVQQALRDGVSDFAAYPDPNGTALRTALGAYHGVNPARILCGNGAAELIFRVCLALRPRRALVPSPTFSEYERSVRLLGGAVEEVPLPLGEAFFRALRPGVDVVFLCTPNNPTGQLLPPETLLRVARRCAENGTVLLVDECFLDFTEGESLLPHLAQYPHLLLLKAFTKYYAMAGLRLGYLLGDEALLHRLEPFAPTWSVSAPAQTAGLAALTTQPGWGNQTRSLVKWERQFLRQGLSELGLVVFPSDCNFLLVKHQKPLAEKLQQRGILVRRCANFTGLDETYFRVGLQTREKNRQLLQAVKEVLCGKDNHDSGYDVQCGEESALCGPVSGALAGGVSGGPV